MAKVGVIGLGMASKPHLEALAELGDVTEVGGIYSPTARRRKEIARRYGLPESGSIEDLLAVEGLRAVLVLTPPNARKEVVSLCAGAGKAVLAEKPLERTVAAASAIAKTCADAKVPLGVVFQNRMREDVRMLKRIIDDGQLGDLASVGLSFQWWRPQSYYDEKGRGTYGRDGGGVLISQAIHSLDLMLHLAGPVTEVRAQVSNTSLHKMEAEDLVTAGLQFTSGAVGSIVATTAAYPGEPERIDVHGTLGSASMCANVLTVRMHDGSERTFGKRQGTGSGADPMAFGCGLHRELIRGFLRSLNSGEAPPVSGEDALGVQRLIEAIVKSGREGTPARVGQ